MKRVHKSFIWLLVIVLLLALIYLAVYQVLLFSPDEEEPVNVACPNPAAEDKACVVYSLVTMNAKKYRFNDPNNAEQKAKKDKLTANVLKCLKDNFNIDAKANGINIDFSSPSLGQLTQVLFCKLIETNGVTGGGVRPPVPYLPGGFPPGDNSLDSWYGVGRGAGGCGASMAWVIQRKNENSGHMVEGAGYQDGAICTFIGQDGAPQGSSSYVLQGNTNNNAFSGTQNGNPVSGSVAGSITMPQ